MPRLVIAHVLVIDTKAKGFRLLVTPPDNSDGHPLNARTTSQFLEEFDLQIAINGDGFYPWWSRGPLDYYPQSGDPVTPNGFAASNGKVYAEGRASEPIFISVDAADCLSASPVAFSMPLQGIATLCRVERS